MSGKSFEKGGRVERQASHGEITGKVVKKLASPMKIKSHRVRASPENPEHLVESGKSGDQAAQGPEAPGKKPG